MIGRTPTKTHRAMKPAPFIYHAPRSAVEAVAMLAEVAPHEGRIIAGGQSLVPAMALRMAQPPHLVDINGVPEFRELTIGADEISIGACVRHAAFHKPIAEGPLGKSLSAVVRHIAHYPVRTRGTFCGSIANADPASEWCLVAATLGAKMIVASARGRRSIDAHDFFRGVMATALEADEVLTAVRLPALSPDTRCGFYEFSRRAGDFAITMAYTVYRLREGFIADPRVGVGGVESQPRRIAEAEAALTGQKPTREVFAAAAEAAAAALEPIDSNADSAQYKREVTLAAVRRALEAAA
jgi:carbon-monoxide dehydrogenase medium subunit